MQFRNLFTVILFLSTMANGKQPPLCSLSDARHLKGPRRFPKQPLWYMYGVKSLSSLFPRTLHSNADEIKRTMMSCRGAQFRWIFVVLLGMYQLSTSFGSEDDCIAYQCCEDECCGPDTSWDDEILYCVPDPGSLGFQGIFATEFVPICEVKVCCEDFCCFDGTYYDPSISCCLPITIPTVSPVAPTPPTPSPDSSRTTTQSPTTIVLLPAPAFRPNVCGFSLDNAAALCQSTTTCNQAKSSEDCYEPCDFFDPSTCPEGQTCFSFVSGCKGFAPSFPNVPFDPSINP
jgi:hypothetical protein